MKTRRITMFIELFLFFAGLLLSFIFTFKVNLSEECKNLLCNILIGLLTGGMVSFLIALPEAFEAKKQTIEILINNSFYIYMYFSQLSNEINGYITNNNDIYKQKFTNYYVERINKHINPIIILTDNVYWHKIKNKGVMRLKNELKYFRLYNITPTALETSTSSKITALEAPLYYKYNTILLKAIKHGDEQYEVTNSMVKPELVKLLAKVDEYIKMIDQVMRIIMNKKQLKKWNKDTHIINKTIKDFK